MGPTLRRSLAESPPVSLSLRPWGTTPGMGRRLVALCVVLAALYACGPVSAARAARGCTLQPTNGTTTRTLGARSYELHVPAGLKGRVPLLITMHALTQSGRT